MSPDIDCSNPAGTESSVKQPILAAVTDDGELKTTEMWDLCCALFEILDVLFSHFIVKVI